MRKLFATLFALLLAASPAAAQLLLTGVGQPTNGSGVAGLSLTGTPGPATQGVSYTFAPTRSNGTSPFTFSIFAGTLPSGLSVDSTTGVISGTTATAGTYSGITERVVDSAGTPATADLAGLSFVVSAAGANIWDVTRASAGFTIDTPTHLTVTYGGTPGSVVGTKGVAANSGVHTWTFTGGGAGGFGQAGVADAAFVAGAGLQDNTHGVGYNGADGTVRFNNSLLQTLGSAGNTSTVDVKVDTNSAAPTLSIQINGGGFSTPVSISSMSFPVYPAVVMFTTASSGTANFATAW